MTLPVCHSRREFVDGGPQFFCAHPRVHIADQLVTASVCGICDRWSEPPPTEFRPFDPAGPLVRRTGPCFLLGEHVDWKDCPTCSGHVRLKVFQCRHPQHHQTTVNDCQLCRDYENPLAHGTVREWAVGITTAPRAIPTIEQTLQSLSEAGWIDARLFAEPGSEIPPAFSQLPVVFRETRLGAFSNWYLALSELYLRQPRADAYFLCQDDVLLARGLREYLERELWPDERLGVVSVYAGGERFARLPQGFHRDDSGWESLGALAYVFPNVAVRSLLGHPLILNHRRRGPANGTVNIDSIVGEWCRQSGFAAYVHAPSLARHLGEASTLFPGAMNSGTRREASFLANIGPPSSGALGSPETADGDMVSISSHSASN